MAETIITKITISINPSPDGIGSIQTIDIETLNDKNPRGVVAIKVLHEAIGQILDEVV